MFDIGFLELVVVAVVALLVLGPEKLPHAARMAGLYLGRIKRSMAEVRAQVEREIGADELRQTLHNEKIMADLAKKQQLDTDGQDTSATGSRSHSEPPQPSATHNDDPTARP